MMLVTATSAIFIRAGIKPNFAGFSPIHLLILVVYGSLFFAFRFLAQGNIRLHRITMRNTYIGACIVTGAFTLLPGRLMHQLVFGSL
jgi:uncharacterized membrane protein